MTDKTITPVVLSWLQSTDLPPADPRGSVRRAMGAIEHTEQVSRSRLWPRRPKPVSTSAHEATRPFRPAAVPATNGHTASRVHPRRSFSMSSAITVVTAAVALALSASYLAAWVLPTDDATPPAALASASPTASSTPSAAPTDPATVAEDVTQPARTRTIAEFPASVDPTELVRSDDGLLYYLDRATGTVSMVDLDGYTTRALGEGDVGEYARAGRSIVGVATSARHRRYVPAHRR